MDRMLKDAASGRFISHPKPNLCRIAGCKSRVHGNDLCAKHYTRDLRHGDPAIRKRNANGEGGISRGYRMIHVNGRRTPEHRYVMECRLGRPIGPDEIVHHKDENKLNNHPKNLMVLKRSEHPAMHPRVLHNLTLGPKSPKKRAQGTMTNPIPPERHPKPWRP